MTITKKHGMLVRRETNMKCTFCRKQASILIRSQSHRFDVCEACADDLREEYTIRTFFLEKIFTSTNVIDLVLGKVEIPEVTFRKLKSRNGSRNDATDET